MKKWIITLLIVVVPMCLFAFLTNHFDAQNSANNTQVAYAEAKPFVYKFTSTMCLDCKELDKVIKTLNPEYTQKINIVSYKVDNADEQVNSLIKKYNVSLVPTMVFVDKNGKETLKIEGLVSKRELEKRLKALING